jgi:hypothetical protein
MNGESPPVVFETLTPHALGKSWTRVADGHLANLRLGYRSDAVGRDAVVDDGIVTSRSKIVNDGRFVENLGHLLCGQAVSVRMGITKAGHGNEGVTTGAKPETEAETDRASVVAESKTRVIVRCRR